MDKKQLLILVSLLALALIGGATAYFLNSRNATEEPQASAPAVEYVTENPLEKAPDLNPTTKTNPFTKVKTNPFE